MIEVNGRWQNVSIIQDGVVIEPRTEKFADPLAVNDNVIDTTVAAILTPLADVKDDVSADKTASKGKRGGGSDAAHITHSASPDYQSHDIHPVGSDFEGGRPASDGAVSQEASDSSSSTYVTTYTSGGGSGGGGGSSRSREDRAANEKPSDETNGKKNDTSTNTGNGGMPSGGVTNSTNTGDLTNSTQGKQDTARPQVTIAYPGGGQVISGVLNVTGTASDTGGNVTKVEVRIGQSPYEKAIPLEASWSEWYAIVEIKNGPVKIEARARDSSGNIQKFSVSVVGVPQQDSGSGTDNTPAMDTVPPSISSPPSLVSEATGFLTKLSSIGLPAVSDNSGNISSVTNNAPSLGFPLGTTAVEWVATDGSGNSAVAYQYVTIKDTTAPAMIPPADIAVESNATLTPVTLLSPKVTDNYDNSPTLTNNAPAKGFPVGTTIVTWTAVDSSNNKATASHEVTVAKDSVVILPTVIASPQGGLFAKSVSVQLSSDAPFATIYYTLDGSTPSISSAKYSLPLSISSATTLKYFARDTAGNKGPVQTQTYVIDTTIPTVTASPSGGSFSSFISVVLKASESSATIYYTTEGSKPTTSSKIYSSPIVVSGSSTLKFFARDVAGNLGAISSQAYIIDLVSPTVTASPEGGLFSVSRSVSLSASESGTTIFFTTDGTAPTEASRKYSSPISISTTTTLRYFAKDPAGNSGTASSQKYTIDKIAPVVTASPLGGIYGSTASVSLKSNEEGAAIYFTMDGSSPTVASPRYSQPLSISTTSVLKYFAKDSAGNAGTVASQTYTIDTIAPKIIPPPNITREATGPLTFIATLGMPTVSDNVGPTVVSNNASSLSFHLGTTKVVWTAKDAVGNKAMVVQTISIKDTTAPTLVAPADKSAQIADGANLITIPLGQPSVSDLADPSPSVFSNAPSQGFPVGTTFVTWTARDDSGNHATAVQKISITALSQPEEKKLIIRIMTINNDEATRAVIRNHLDEDDFINNFRLPVLGMYPGQNQALNEESIEAVKTSIASEIPASRVDVDYIEYDNEAGNGDLSTPESELVDPAASTNQAMKIIHDAGYKSGVAPTRRILMQELGGVQWANVDYVVMQLQKVVGTQEFRDIADKVSSTTRKQNSDIVIFAQINPALNSVEEIVDAINSVRDDIDGVGIVWTMSDATQLDKLLTALGR